MFFERAICFEKNSEDREGERVLTHIDRDCISFEVKLDSLVRTKPINLK